MLSKEAFAGHGTRVVARWEESGDEATRKCCSLNKGKAKICAHDNDNRFDLQERSNVGTMLPISPASWAMSWDKPEKVKIANKNTRWNTDIMEGYSTPSPHMSVLEYKEKLGVLRFLWRNPAKLNLKDFIGAGIWMMSPLISSRAHGVVGYHIRLASVATGICGGCWVQFPVCPAFCTYNSFSSRPERLPSASYF